MTTGGFACSWKSATLSRCLAQLEHWLTTSPQATALQWLDEADRLQQCSWSELYGHVLDCVQTIQQQGFQPGDRLLHQGGNTSLGVIVALASMVYGTVEVPLDPEVDATSVAAFERLVSGRSLELASWPASHQTMVSVSKLVGAAAAAAAAAQHAPALILFTSGSTGQPKGVTLSQHNLFQNALGKLQAVPQTQQDVRLMLLPIWHAYARTCDLVTWLLSGCKLAIGYGFGDWQRLAPRVQPTLINTVPSMAERIAQSALLLSPDHRLKCLGCGGAAMSESLFEAFAKRGVTVIQGYGLTEASPVICSATPHNARPGYVGCPIVGCNTRIDESGRLFVSGAGVMLGYWEPGGQSFRALPEACLDTGDYVERSPEDGQFRILGRDDDRLILSNGRKLFAGPIEQLLQQIAGVAYALLVAEDRHLIAYLDADLTLQPLQAYRAAAVKLMSELPEWQRPRRYCFFTSSLTAHRELFSRKGTLKRRATEQRLASLNFLNADADGL